VAFAHIGPFTAVTEALATAVGAGAVLGSVAAGIWELIRGSTRAELEGSALLSSYIGGAAGAGLALVDLVLSYALMR
jgi:hypothetical protein